MVFMALDTGSPLHLYTLPFTFPNHCVLRGPFVSVFTVSSGGIDGGTGSGSPLASFGHVVFPEAAHCVVTGTTITHYFFT